MPVFAYEKHYIKNNKGQTTGYTKTYSNGKTVQYNKKGQVEYTYKKILPVRLQSIPKPVEN